MNRSFFTNCLVWVFLAEVAVLASFGPSPAHLAGRTAPERGFEFTYLVQVPAMPDARGDLRLWVPLPGQDGYQEIENLQVDSPAPYRQGRDAEYGNRFAEFKPSLKQSASGFAVTIRFTAIRHEHRAFLQNAPLNNSRASGMNDPMLRRYLEPDNLVPLDGTIAALAKELTAGDSTALQKARHIYDYVVSTLRYDKSGEGWGRGDAVWACASKRGNCTDFHSLLIGMLRSSGIPARFEIGFPLPEDKSEGSIPGYHCWADFYVDGLGWVPVDASEAWQFPAKRDYFFGAHDADRVFFTFGRDITLSSDQKGPPLNYFIYPYAELNGQPLKKLQARFSFRDLPPREASSRGISR